jgi:diadenosine tetraphosphatase ApaH/serine/threonine PP2A family protein phosphatase
MVGYGPNPNECVALLRDRAQHAVLGNHDLAALENYGTEYFNEAARTAIEWTQTRLDAESRTWLNALPYELRLPEFLLVHGAPVNYFEYILDKRTAAAAFDRTDAPLIFVGHTHIAEVYGLRPDGEIEHRHLQQGGEFTLEDGMRYLVNVGSIGQPRDLNPRCSLGFYDAAARTVTISRVEYPIARVQEKIHDVRLPEALARRLVVGR